MPNAAVTMEWNREHAQFTIEWCRFYELKGALDMVGISLDAWTDEEGCPLPDAEIDAWLYHGEGSPVQIAKNRAA